MIDNHFRPPTTAPTPPGGHQLITADADGVCKLWDLRTFSCLETFISTAAEMKRAHAKPKRNFSSCAPPTRVRKGSLWERQRERERQTAVAESSQKARASASCYQCSALNWWRGRRPRTPFSMQDICGRGGGLAMPSLEANGGVVQYTTQGRALDTNSPTKAIVMVTRAACPLVRFKRVLGFCPGPRYHLHDREPPVQPCARRRTDR